MASVCVRKRESERIQSGRDRKEERKRSKEREGGS